MNVKIWQIFFFLLLFTTLQTSKAAEKILIVRHEKWSHPVEKIFKKYSIQLYKVSYSKNGTYPTFYAKFKYHPHPKTSSSIDFHKIYSEILKANYYFPYALVDKDDDIRINVGWKDREKTKMVVDIYKASSVSTFKTGNAGIHKA